ncbi:MAG: peptidoglycan DD-metalloendopeptidase family protein [Bacteroidales bacterium]|jgi:septal ring factor EnvC (AmiA/AmiB activator)|nr:peptidoglycan DD-metalloendopeptidase family protein [Bacteroidales bacterium]
MNKPIAIFLLSLVYITVVEGQTRTEIEAQRKKTLEEIEYVDNLLSNTSKEKSESMNALKILGNKLSLRELVIKGMNEEIGLLEERIDLNRTAIDLMEEDLRLLRQEYTNAILNSYKSKKLNPEIVYILSARDFNQGYKRIKYLQQVSKIRRNESEIISELIEEIEKSKAKLEADLERISDVQKKELQQKNLLQGEQNRKQRMVRNLTAREKQLQKELEEKKRVAQKLEKELARIIAEERKKASTTSLTPEQKLVGENFLDNKGKLPWPVERGVITNHFGKHQHPVLKYLTEDNIGIEITSSGKVDARSIFKGEVTAVSAISGSNMTVIVRHGNFLTVYSNLVNLKVKKGDKVETKAILGEVFRDPGSGNACTLKFMIFEGKYLDPELWIAKN